MLRLSDRHQTNDPTLPKTEPKIQSLVTPTNGDTSEGGTYHINGKRVNSRNRVACASRGTGLEVGSATFPVSDHVAVEGIKRARSPTAQYNQLERSMAALPVCAVPHGLWHKVRKRQR